MEDSRTMKFVKALLEGSGTNCIELIGKCQTCAKEVSILVFKKGLEIEGNGGIVKGVDERPLFKCTECLEKDGGRISSQRTEIFTRVVGYLRPIQAFNKGKIEEFKMRTNYKMGGTALDPDGHAADHEHVNNYGAGCMERPRL